MLVAEVLPLTSSDRREIGGPPSTRGLGPFHLRLPGWMGHVPQDLAGMAEEAGGGGREPPHFTPPPGGGIRGNTPQLIILFYMFFFF